MKRYAIRVTGKVQGVWFRSSARNTALQLGLSGFARNEPDGSVYIEVEGDDQSLRKFLDWCHQGPRESAVEAVTHSEHQPSGHQDFTTC